MLKIIVKEGENIERALKRFKNKYRKTKVLYTLRDKQQYSKPSEVRRKNKEKAIYRERYLRSLEE
ncbi:30S ribosomal protein S21 [Galbibacter marinus]|uniref:Small ribosomal subunit protein bS21 n=1 Tax=Galbibacter marinus TaxID=555500 RepID=K2PYT4_9FLAO|nr:30S ribosomal protein S21 [Galbibacter marinus]EKF56619.1 30S ribosomal protein S21 [Galbibacter marinus]